ncbi:MULTISPECIES: type II toxin-antitoxin system RelE/ParE family toxin [Terrabacteria group]|uniref:type II toxin-antitoxin system RelE/ParE family toxin n=1 Tax=Bacillati TaxID=1783272 RepID=UPI001939A221|nr:MULTISPECIES: type II toxin-antitoxin system RelE/ParE family toxin [Terrabacteria group]MBW9212348.1 type II toxin-antitoxin system RelE/ParE family toxin [Trueperella sp. zg.1013]QRG86118.1 type II toxin-antitoxin system RelE/ParE family toxin [Bulleidia sp. zg-1006]
MSYLVTLTREAEEDLRGIYAYITFSLLSPQNAKGQIDRIQKVIQSLDEFPMRHRLVDSEPWKSRGVHIVPCDNFLIFYLVKEEKAEVIISRILYGKRNLEEELNSDSNHDKE